MGYRQKRDRNNNLIKLQGSLFNIIIYTNNGCVTTTLLGHNDYNSIFVDNTRVDGINNTIFKHEKYLRLETNNKFLHEYNNTIRIKSL